MSSRNSFGRGVKSNGSHICSHSALNGAPSNISRNKVKVRPVGIDNQEALLAPPPASLVAYGNALWEEARQRRRTIRGGMKNG